MNNKKNYFKIRRVISILCVFMLLFNFIIPNIVSAENKVNNTTITYNENDKDDFDITEDTVTINGVVITKEEVIEARKTLKLMKKNVTPKNRTASVPFSDGGEYGGLLTFNANSASALKSLGVGLAGAFGAISYKLGLVIHSYEFWRCSIDGYRLNILFTPEGMLVNNFSISYSWFTQLLMENTDKKEEPKTEAKEEDPLGEVLEGAEFEKKTNTGLKEWEKEGDYETALGDFEKLKPKNVKNIETQYGPGKCGELSNGHTVVVRPGSTYNRHAPTLEEQNKVKKPKNKIRYVK